ncbi:hypothetical protein KKF84_11745, partial [Myxococcota bacterium]|nr:hypothetical protein [Myxococcota bacterium]
MLPIWLHSARVHGEETATRILRAIGLTPEYLQNPGGWVSLDAAHAWVSETARDVYGLTGLPPMDHPFYNFYREAGRQGASREALGPLWHAIRVIGDPMAFYSLSTSQVKKFNLVTQTRVVEKEPGMTVLSFSMLDGHKDNPGFCHNRMGYLENIPLIWGLPRALVFHEQCMHDPLHPSDACVYRVVYKDVVRLKRTALMGMLTGAALGALSHAFGAGFDSLGLTCGAGALGGLLAAGWFQLFYHRRFHSRDTRHYDEMITQFDSRYTELRDSQERFAQLTHAIDEAFWLCSPDRSRIHYVSPAFETVFDVDPVRVIDSPQLWNDRLAPENPDVLTAPVDKLREYTYEIIDSQNQRRTVNERVYPIFDSRGGVYRLAGVSRDISEIIETKKELAASVERFRQTQKLESLGRLTGGIAHDFNNMLTVILGYSEIIQDNLPPHSPLASSIAEVIKAGDSAASLTDQLLAFSRKQLVEPRVVDPCHLMVRAQNMLQRLIGEDITLEFNITEGLGFIRIDPVQMDQVLVNLAVNARDAMPTGGVLRFSMETCDDPHPGTVESQPGGATGEYLCISVRDTGTGMDQATIDRIFEPFFTTKEEGKGTGLGLSTVYGIVHQNGGRIGVESTLRGGSVFHISLPLVRERDAVTV